jgi:hypothetical protein
VLAGKHPSGAAKAGRHLVADQQDVVGVTELSHPPQVSVGLYQHPRRPLHEWLDDHRGRTRPVVLEELLQVNRIAGARSEGVEKEGAIQRVELLDPTHGDGAQRVAVVGVLEADEACPIWPPALRPELKRHLECDLDGGRPALGVEHPSQIARRHGRKLASQLDCWLVCQTEHCRVGDAIELGAYGGVDRGVTVTVHVAPQRRHSVDVNVAVDVVQVRPGAPVDD